jgi:peptidoglycan/LPS O-acetylase OafA/YrhL
LEITLRPRSTFELPSTDATANTGTPVEFKRPHYRVLDGIRGLAIIGVLLTHASYVFESRVVERLTELGWLGVDLFFVLSGFLITGILIDTKSAVNRALSFYARRMLRIFPIYYLTLAVVLVAQMHWGWIAACAEMPTLRTRLPYLFYYLNLKPLWNHGNAHQTLLGHFWSLAVEEQFYFVWPLVVWRLSTKAVYKLCGAALCVALAVRIVSGARFGFGTWMLFFPLTRADGLFVGSGIAALFASKYRPSKRLLAAAAAAAGFGLVTIAAGGHLQLLYGGPLMSTYGLTCVAVLFGAFIAYSLLFHGDALPKAVKARWLRTFGRYSYGMYVFHLPLYYLFDHLARTYLSLTFPLPGFQSLIYVGSLISVTYGVAWISYNVFEQRFLRLKGRFAPAFAAPALSAPANTLTGGSLEISHAPIQVKPGAVT